MKGKNLRRNKAVPKKRGSYKKQKVYIFFVSDIALCCVRLFCHKEKKSHTIPLTQELLQFQFNKGGIFWGEGYPILVNLTGQRTKDR